MEILGKLLVMNPWKRGNVGDVLMTSSWLRTEREKWIEKGKESRDRLQHVPSLRRMMPPPPTVRKNGEKRKRIL